MLMFISRMELTSFIHVEGLALKVLSIAGRWIQLKLGSFDRSLLKVVSWRFFRKIRPPTILWELCKFLERILVSKLTIVQQFRWLRGIFIAHLDLEIEAFC